MGDQEIYVAANGSDLALFDDITGQKIAAVYGYHYGFADFNGDPAYLQQAYAVEQPLNSCTSLYYVRDGRVNVSIVPDIYLQKFLEAYPQYQGRFMAGPQPDQVYEHSIVVSEDAPTALDEIVRQHSGGSRRVAMDHCGPPLTLALPDAGFVLYEAQEPIERARAVKSDEEVQCMRITRAVAEHGMVRMRDALVPGITENGL